MADSVKGAKPDPIWADLGPTDGTNKHHFNEIAIIGLEKLLKPLFAHLPEGPVRDDAYRLMGERITNRPPGVRFRNQKDFLDFVRAGIPKA